MSEWEKIRLRLEIFCKQNKYAVTMIAKDLGLPRQQIHGYIKYGHEPLYSVGIAIRKHLQLLTGEIDIL